MAVSFPYSPCFALPPLSSPSASALVLLRESLLKKLLEDELGKVNQASRDSAEAGAGSSGGVYKSTMSETDRKEAERARAVAAAADAADARGVSPGGNNHAPGFDRTVYWKVL